MPLVPSNAGSELPLWAAAAEALQPQDNPPARGLQPSCPVPADAVPDDVWRLASILASSPTATFTSARLGERLYPDKADPGREVRELIQYWYVPLAMNVYERTGRMLTGDGTGYHLTADPAEIRHYVRTLCSRADGNLARLRNVAICLEITPWQDVCPAATVIDSYRRGLSSVS